MKTHRATLVTIIALILTGMSCTRAQTAPDPPRKPKATEQGKQRGWLGVSVGDVDMEEATPSRSQSASGALVREVAESSPAEKAGIEEDDIIVEFRGKAIADADDLVSAVRKSKPGDSVPVVVMRGTQKKTIQVTLGKSPSRMMDLGMSMPRAPRIPRVHVRTLYGSEMYGLDVMDLNGQLGEYFGAPYGKGVLVKRVSGKSAAAAAGFKAGDVIITLGSEDIEETEDLMSALDEYKHGDTATFKILRKGTNLTLALTVPEDDRRTHGYFEHEFDFAPGAHSRVFQFNTEEFREGMKHLQERLRGVGEEIRTKMKDVQRKLKRELQQVGT